VLIEELERAVEFEAAFFGELADRWRG
jgi:hypothetical protein